MEDVQDKDVPNESEVSPKKERKKPKQTINLNRKKALKVLKLLEEPIPMRSPFGTCCRYNVSNSEVETTSWDSPTYVIQNIRTCILQREWHNLPDLIRILMKYSRKNVYNPVVKEIGYLNAVINAECSDDNVLKEFHRLFFIKAKRGDLKDPEFDCWYREGCDYDSDIV